MAGIAILKKANSSKITKTANLNIALHSTPASICCCLWLQQPSQVVESSCNTNNNNKPMKEISNNYCHNSSTSSCCNYKQQQQQQKHKKVTQQQRPLTLSIAVIIISLSILLMQMPTMVKSKAIYGESSSSAAASSHSNDDTSLSSSVTETSAELESKLLLSMLAEAQPASTDESSDELTSKEVLKHIQRTRQHQKERRMRLRKRHTRDLLINKFLHENGQNLEWRNPCNADKINRNLEARHVTKQQTYQYLKKLADDMHIYHETLNDNAKVISLNDMDQWDIYEDVYKFLPKLNANSNIALSRWYRHMQVYVAAFGYLARTQYKYDMKYQMYAGNISVELNELLIYSRTILCDLETTIMASAPQNSLRELKTISRKAMNNRMNFVTKEHQMNGAIVAAIPMDLKFAKSKYFKFLLDMQIVLNKKLHKMGKRFGIMDSKEDNSSGSIIVGDNSNTKDWTLTYKSDSSLSVQDSLEFYNFQTPKGKKQKK